MEITKITDLSSFILHINNYIYNGGIIYMCCCCDGYRYNNRYCNFLEIKENNKIQKVYALDINKDQGIKTIKEISNTTFRLLRNTGIIQYMENKCKYTPCEESKFHKRLLVIMIHDTIRYLQKSQL